MTSHIVIVGGGLAGAKTAQGLRDQGYAGPLTLIAAEPHLPYERPPLSKDYLMGKSSFHDALALPGQWYADHGVDLRLEVQATSLDAAGHLLGLDDGTNINYGKLVLATGSIPRRLGIPGADASGVHYLRTREDSDAIRATFGSGRHLAIIGGGWIGLEVAAAARMVGTDVTVIEMAELPLLGVLGEQIAPVFADLHRDHGVDLRLGAQVEEISVRGERATGVRLADGTHIETDAIVVGIGVRPDVDLATLAGLATDDGVLVDAQLRTSDPDVFAVGDIANHDHPVLGHRVRVEHWANALNQPAAAAAALLGGTEPYTALPYFYTDQYDLGMEYIGHATPGSYEQVVVRGDLEGREFVAFWLDGDRRIKAAMNVNVWDVPDEVGLIISAGTRVNPESLANPDVPYGEL